MNYELFKKITAPLNGIPYFEFCQELGEAFMISIVISATSKQSMKNIVDTFVIQAYKYINLLPEDDGQNDT